MWASSSLQSSLPRCACAATSAHVGGAARLPWHHHHQHPALAAPSRRDRHSSRRSSTAVCSTLPSQQPQQAQQLASSAAAATAAAQPPKQLLDRTSAPALLRRLDNLIFDQDGVLWRGQELVPNAVEALHAFRDAGKRLLFVTNNSSKSRAEYAAKFASLGFKVAPDEIVSSSYAAAAYLHSTGYRQQRLAAGHDPCVLLLGSGGMRQQLEAVGLQVIDAESLGLPLQDNVADMLSLRLDRRIGAVVLGWDARFSYSKLVYATALLREQRCLFVATNLDHADVIGLASAASGSSSSSSSGGNGTGGGSSNAPSSSSSSSSSSSVVERVMPGTGALVAALQVASGVEPVNVGKGGAWLLQHLCQQHALDPSHTAVIGDRLDTDVAMGRQGGFTTLLPLTGVTTLEEAIAAPAAEAPHYILGSVADLAGL